MPKTKPFDKYYSDYERWFEENQYTYESELKAIEHFVPGSARGIEIGSGSGRFALPLGIKEGIEPSYSMRKLARNEGMQVSFGVAEQLPLEDETYDFALMVTTICFVDDAGQAMRELHRILKPGGRVIISLVDKNSPIGTIYQENRKKSRFYQEAVFFSAEEVETLLNQSGFENIEFVQTLFGKPDNVVAIQDFKPGYGEGSFVVAKGEKKTE
jgi:SAM-dependent methyltransferase